MITFTTPTSLQIGDGAPEFEDLRGVDATSYGLSSFSDKPLLALVFISNGCPTVRVYEDRLKDLQESYGPRGVQIVAINSNNPHLSPSDSYPEMVRRSEDGGFNFPYLQDEDGSVARAYGAISTPHAFVLDRERRLSYRGRIDDSRDPSKITSHDLESALADVLEGRTVEAPDTAPFGCAIVR
jgi:peroxiredoxin